MASMNYVMITVAACEYSYQGEFFGRVANLAGELKDKAGAVAIRYGVGMTGNHAGNVALFQGYEDLDGVDRAFDVYAASSDYVEAMASGKVQVQFRNIWQLDTSVGYGDSSATTPKYGVVTRFRSSDPMTETMQELSGVLLSLIHI